MAYSQVRGETHDARIHILKNLMVDPTIIDLWDDGSDMVIASYKSGAKVLFYLIELPISTHELQKTFRENTQKNLHTIFLCWADMLLPRHGAWYIPDPWMKSLLALQTGCLYGYDSHNKGVSLFPVYFDPQTNRSEHYIRWGTQLRFSDIRWETRHTNGQYLQGSYKTAYFKPVQNTASRSTPLPEAHHLTTEFRLLDLTSSATLIDVREAYRQKARLYHPDHNSAPEATEKMQAINAAYQNILKYFES